MSDKNDRLHPGTAEIGERFETWWNNEGSVIPHDTEASRKHAAWIAWHNGAYVAAGVVTQASDILLADLMIEAKKHK
jgi:hypothetical protein